MKFIHIADVHLGAEPEGLKLGSKSRGQEIWESLEQITKICEWEEVDLLLIAGDLFKERVERAELSVFAAYEDKSGVYSGEPRFHQTRFLLSYIQVA